MENSIEETRKQCIIFMITIITSDAPGYESSKLRNESTCSYCICQVNAPERFSRESDSSSECTSWVSVCTLSRILDCAASSTGRSTYMHYIIDRCTIPAKSEGYILHEVVVSIPRSRYATEKAPLHASMQTKPHTRPET